jgi:hypothetical protein
MVESTGLTKVTVLLAQPDDLNPRLHPPPCAVRAIFVPSRCLPSQLSIFTDGRRRTLTLSKIIPTAHEKGESDWWVRGRIA